MRRLLAASTAAFQGGPVSLSMRGREGRRAEPVAARLVIDAFDQGIERIGIEPIAEPGVVAGEACALRRKVDSLHDLVLADVLADERRHLCLDVPHERCE